MQTGVRDANLRADSADRQFAGDAVHAAIARAADAIGKLTGKRFVHAACVISVIVLIINHWPEKSSWK